MKSKREKRIQTLIRRLGPMRTMLLVGFIDTLPQREHDTEGWFVPDHARIQKVMNVKQPIYWQLLQDVRDRGLIHRRDDDQHGKQYQVDFGAIEVYCRLSWLDVFLKEFRKAFGIR